MPAGSSSSPGMAASTLMQAWPSVSKCVKGAHVTAGHAGAATGRATQGPSPSLVS